jgi:hypothetical protein
VLEPYTSALQQYVALVNQIATLNNRVGVLTGLLNETPAFNPVGVLDLVSYLDRLANVYRPDRNSLLTNLEACLNATSGNVTTLCAPIIRNTITTAFEWYDPSGGQNPNFFAQQNTLALQYTGTQTVTPGIATTATAPLDDLYIDELPPLGGAFIAGEAALVSFLDRKVSLEPPYVAMLVLERGQPLSTNNVSTVVRENPPALTPFDFYFIDNAGLGAFAGTEFTTVSCTPTFADPCAIDYSTVNGLETYQNVQIEGLFD